VARYLIRRLLSSIGLILAGATFIFLLTHFGGGDPARLILGDTATAESIRLLRREMGLDRPMLEQYAIYMYNLIQLDLGRSWYSRQPVVEEILAVLPNTLLLTATAMLFAWFVGITIGVISAYYRESGLDLSLRIFVLVNISEPGFVSALLSILIFAVYLGWLPTSGIGTWQHLVLPAVTLGLNTAAMLARMSRGSMLEVLGQDYVMAARARGVPEFWVVMRHALRNALLSVITVMGLQVGLLMGGAVITETIFAWPGMGRALVQAIFGEDFPMIRGIAIVFLSIFVAVNFVVDLVYMAVDPRLKLMR
jgi:peptide/nickel transport system permease protein